MLFKQTPNDKEPLGRSLGEEHCRQSKQLGQAAKVGMNLVCLRNQEGQWAGVSQPGGVESIKDVSEVGRCQVK